MPTKTKRRTRNKAALVGAVLTIIDVQVQAQESIIPLVADCIADVETGNLNEKARNKYKRTDHYGRHCISKDLWADTTIYRFGQGKALYLPNQATDKYIANVYATSALEMLCKCWFKINQEYPTIKEIAACWRFGLSATLKDKKKITSNYSKRVENLVMKRITIRYNP